MNISVRILQLKGRTHELIRRFPVAVFWQVFGFFVGAGIILLRPDLYTDAPNSELFEHLVRLAPAVFGAWMTAVMCRLITDAFPAKRSVLLRTASSGILFLLLSYAWYGVENPSRQLIVGTIGVYLALFFLTLFFLERINKTPGLPALLVAAAFSLGTSILLFLGLSVCIAAFWALIITDARAWIAETTYLFAGHIAYSIWGLGAFLGTLAKPDERYEFSAAAQKVLLYLFFPVYLLLLLVLYLYVCKIISAGEMPVGTMNWYASFALLGFAFFFSTLAAQTRLPLFSRFLKWALLLFLPILAVQLYGVWLRYEAYGLTTPRYTSMICTFCGIYALAVAFLRRKPQQIYLCAAILALTFSLTPLNVVDVPLRDQEARLSRILTENNLIQNGKFILRDDTPPEVIEEIKDIAFYIGKESSPLAAKIIRECSGSKAPEPAKRYDMHFNAPDTVDIAGYQTLRRFSNVTPEGVLTITRADGAEEHIDLAPYIERVTTYAEENHTFILPVELQEYEVGAYRLHFDSVHTERTRDGKVHLRSINGFILMQ